MFLKKLENNSHSFYLFYFSKKMSIFQFLFSISLMIFHKFFRCFNIFFIINHEVDTNKKSIIKNVQKNEPDKMTVSKF